MAYTRIARNWRCGIALAARSVVQLVFLSTGAMLGCSSASDDASTRMLTPSDTPAQGAGGSGKADSPYDVSFEAYDDPVRLKEAAEETVAYFLGDMREAKVAPPFVPTVVIQTTPVLASFEWSTRRLVLPLWNDVPQDVRDMFLRWLEGEVAGREFFEATFHWFLFAHELTHMVQTARGVFWDRFTLESHANDTAVAYWFSRGQRVRLARYAEMLDRAIERMQTTSFKDGVDPKLFDLNYATLVQNPEDYGFVQFTMIRNAIRKADTLTLAGQIRDKTANGVDCKVVAQRIGQGCPSTASPEEWCHRTVLLVSSTMVPACETASAALMECYGTSEPFGCGSQGAAPFPPSCVALGDAYEQCSKDNGVQ